MSYTGSLEAGEISIGGSTGVVARPLGLGLTWDTTQVSNVAERRYATFAEVLAALGNLESTATISLKGTCLANVPGTYDWSKVILVGNNDGTTLVGSEGVVIKDVQIDAIVEVSSTATTTNFLTYSDGVQARINRARISGSGTRGCIATLGAISFFLYFGDGAILSTNAFETTSAIGWYIHTLRAEWEGGSGGHILGTLGTLTVYRNFETEGQIELDVWGGGAPTYITTEKLGSVIISGTPSIGQVLTATSPTAANWQTPSGGGGGTGLTTYHHWARYAGINWTPTTGVGSYTVGISFRLYSPMKITGAAFWCVTVASGTRRVSVWKDSTLVYTEDFPVGAGTTWNEVTFATPVTVAAGDLGALYTVGFWDTSGTGYTKVTTTPPAAYSASVAGSYFAYGTVDLFGSGDVRPTLGGGTECYPVEPILGEP